MLQCIANTIIVIIARVFLFSLFNVIIFAIITTNQLYLRHIALHRPLPPAFLYDGQLHQPLVVLEVPGAIMLPL